MFTEGGHSRPPTPLPDACAQDFLTDQKSQPDPKSQPVRWADTLADAVDRPRSDRYEDWSAAFRTAVTKAVLAPGFAGGKLDVTPLRAFEPKSP
jgi:hypothetical protein